MKRYVNFAGLFGALLLTVYAGLPGPFLQIDDTEELYFPETGHTVREPFVDYFVRSGGVVAHGFPITGDYVDPRTGLLVQYFEKSRLEWHPGNPEPYRVLLGLLGDELGKRQPPIPIAQIPAPNDPNCQYFNETGHSVCLLFRDYFLQNGGIDRFGYPITEFTNEDGRLVQYFQRARMEWHPEKPRGQQVQLAPLGSMYFQAAGLPRDLLTPISAGQGQVRSIVARGSVIQPVAVSGGQQTTFVYVTDQLGNPIGGAAVTLVVHFPSGDTSFTLPPTSASGTAFTTFTVPQIEAGTVVWMEFIIGYQGVFGNTRTSFMIWY